jgi:hypothetical protein
MYLIAGVTRDLHSTSLHSISAWDALLTQPTVLALVKEAELLVMIALALIFVYVSQWPLYLAKDIVSAIIFIDISPSLLTNYVPQGFVWTAVFFYVLPYWFCTWWHSSLTHPNHLVCIMMEMIVSFGNRRLFNAVMLQPGGHGAFLALVVAVAGIILLEFGTLLGLSEHLTRKSDDLKYDLCFTEGALMATVGYALVHWTRDPQRFNENPLAIQLQQLPLAANQDLQRLRNAQRAARNQLDNVGLLARLSMSRTLQQARKAVHRAEANLRRAQTAQSGLTTQIQEISSMSLVNFVSWIVSVPPWAMSVALRGIALAILWKFIKPLVLQDLNLSDLSI